jgi:parallel beta-helix repeat protein
MGIQISTNSDSSLVYNNIVYNQGYYGINIYGGANSIVFNNVVFGNLTTWADSSYGEIVVQNGATTYLYNNSIKSASVNGIYIDSSAGSGVGIKNNIVYDQVGGYYAIKNEGSGVTAQFNDFYGSTSYGSATQDQNINENPEWDANYRLTSSSSQGSGHVRDGGVDLSATFTTDKNGIIRPQGPGWDMGAYELTLISPPTNLRIIQ